MVYAGFLAGVTRRIAIGMAGIVLPLRDPIAVAKQATSLDHLTRNRFLLGLSTGDRPVEYPAFGASFEDRAERFRDAHALIRAVTEESHPIYRSGHYGVLDGGLDLLPKPVGPRLPTLAIGRAGQTVEWLAGNMDGWIGTRATSFAWAKSSHAGARPRPMDRSSHMAMAASSISTAILTRRCALRTASPVVATR